MTLRAFLEAQGIKPDDLLDQEIGVYNFSGWSVAAHLTSGGPGDLGVLEIEAHQYIGDPRSR